MFDDEAKSGGATDIPEGHTAIRKMLVIEHRHELSWEVVESPLKIFTVLGK